MSTNWVAYAEELRDDYTRAELRDMCNDLDITKDINGNNITTKTLHETLVQTIVAKLKKDESEKESESETVNDGYIPSINAGVSSYFNESGEEVTSIYVSCGAASGNFPVIGKNVREVSELLSEILNIDKLSEPVVNGEQVGLSYVLKSSDVLEFVKLSGKKG